MANLIMAFPNWLDAAAPYAAVSHTGGVWSADLPFANALNGNFATKAQTADTHVQHMVRWIDLGVERSIRVVAIPWFEGVTKNLRARLRVFSAYEDTGSSVLGDTGTIEVYREVFPSGALATWDEQFVDGKFTAEELDLYKVPFLHVFDTAVVGRYCYLELIDTGNAGAGGAGYVRFPRLYVSPGWQPSINVSADGASVVIEDRSITQEALGGTKFFEQLDKRRIARLSMGVLPQDEAFSRALDMQTRLGRTGDLFFSLDPADSSNLHRWSFAARMRTLSPVETAFYNHASTTFELEEVL